MPQSPQREDRGNLPFGAGAGLKPATPPMRLVLQPTGFAVDIEYSDAVLGRHSEADVRLPLPDVSRRHCRFVNHTGVWQVIDLDSLNGVFVNGSRVSKSELREGDILGIGGFQFLVLMTEPLSSINESSKTQAMLPPVPDHLPKRRAS